MHRTYSSVNKMMKREVLLEIRMMRKDVDIVNESIVNESGELEKHRNDYAFKFPTFKLFLRCSLI